MTALTDPTRHPCVHGEMKPHGEVGNDWCAGGMSNVGNLWRRELEWQMNLKPFAGLAGVESIVDAPDSSASDSSAGSPAPATITLWDLSGSMLGHEYREHAHLEGDTLHIDRYVRLPARLEYIEISISEPK